MYQGLRYKPLARKSLKEIATMMKLVENFHHFPKKKQMWVFHEHLQEGEVVDAVFLLKHALSTVF